MQQAYNNGGEDKFSDIDLWTEFTGSTAAESAVEASVAHTKCKTKLTIASCGDIKPTCRTVCMETRKTLSVSKSRVLESQQSTVHFVF